MKKITTTISITLLLLSSTSSAAVIFGGGESSYKAKIKEGWKNSQREKIELNGGGESS